MSLLVDRIVPPAVVREAPFPLLIAEGVLDSFRRAGLER